MKRVSYIVVGIIFLFIIGISNVLAIEVDSSTTFIDAINNEEDVKLTNDITLSQDINVSNITIDLNNHILTMDNKTITVGGDTIVDDTSSTKGGLITNTSSTSNTTNIIQIGTQSYSGNLTINNGKIEDVNGKYVINGFRGELILNNGEIIGHNLYTIYGAANFNMTINNGYISQDGDYYAIYSKGDITMNDGIIESVNNTVVVFKDLTITGGKITSEEAAAIYGYSNTTIDISGGEIKTNGVSGRAIYLEGGNSILIHGGKVLAPNGIGLESNGNANVKVSSGEINGKTGIDVRSGSLEISGGEIISSGTHEVVGSSGNTINYGSALTISQREENEVINVKITGGELSGDVPLSEINPMNYGSASLEKITIDIKGGTFKNLGSSTSSVNALHNNFITGGAYTYNPTDYIKEGYKATLIDGMYHVTKLYTITVGNIENGEVSVNKVSAAKGEVVTISVTPKEGYVLEEIKALNGETVIPINDDSFIMPDGNVTVLATFKLKEVASEEVAINTDTKEETKKTSVPQTADNLLLYLIISGISVSALYLAYGILNKYE